MSSTLQCLIEVRINKTSVICRSDGNTGITAFVEVRLSQRKVNHRKHQNCKKAWRTKICLMVRYRTKRDELVYT